MAVFLKCSSDLHYSLPVSVFTEFIFKPHHHVWLSGSEFELTGLSISLTQPDQVMAIATGVIPSVAYTTHYIPSRTSLVINLSMDR